MDKAKKQKKEVTLISYELRATIPTGPYANICPCITVQASSIEEAQEFVIPHIDELFEKYLDITERSRVSFKESISKRETLKNKPIVNILPNEVVEDVDYVIADKDKEEEEKIKQKKVHEERPQSPAFENARATIMACKSIEALDIIFNRIHESVKLDDIDKMDLIVLINQKKKELKN